MKKALILMGFCSITVWASETDTQFQQVVERDWQFRLQEYPEMAAYLDPNTPDTRYTDISEKAQAARAQFWREELRQLDALPREQLTHDNRINWRILRDQTLNALNDYDTGTRYYSFNSDTQYWADWPRLAEGRRFNKLSDYDNYLLKLSALPAAMRQQIQLLRDGLKKGFTQPQAVLAGRDSSIRQQIVDKASDSDFYAPFKSLSSNLSEAEKQALQKQAAAVITKKVVPAYRELLKFFTHDYVPQARLSLAATSLPNGEAFYRAQIYQYTTLNLSPQQIHDIGVSEVKRIREQMEAIKTQVKFDGDLQAFLNHLRSDAQFLAKSTHELLAEASYFSKKIDGLLPKYFGYLPRQPYGVVPVPDAIAPYYTAGRYVGSNDPKQSGAYWVNTSKLDSRTLWSLPALTLHEAVPGHHLQNAIAAEQGEQPPFRRYSYISAYGEGWGLYSEYLGQEMGIYETPYQQFGRLVYEMWRACRLVVDTGVHQFGWSREQALDYMKANTALSLHEITTEVDRYISWPAQALSYKLGEIKIRELRAKSEQALGSKFDLRAFHDTILKLGSVPLSVLEEEIDLWIKEQQNKPD